MMHKIAVAVLMSVFLLSSFAAGPALAADTCKSQAADKKLAGAAFNSFMKKCQKDAKASCDATAAEKKLHGAAQTSFTKKCLNDAVGK